MAQLIDGKQISKEIKDELKAEVQKLKEQGREICLAVVQVGEDPASTVYVNNKKKACAYIGIESRAYELPETTSEEELVSLVEELNGDDSVNGILVQLPLPKHLDAERILACIPAAKDVDGFSAENIGRLALNEEGTVACTPLGVMELLRRYHVETRGKRAVIIGRSNIVGRPMALLLLNADATVTVCHSRTVNLAEECARADILVAAIGKPNFITADMVKEGAVVIDVGINRVDGKLIGDVDFAAVSQKASLITPVPGGVGPMTIAMLLQNAISCAERAMR